MMMRSGLPIWLLVCPTSVGKFYPSRNNLVAARKFDDRVLQRYLKKIEAHCRGRWVKGERHPYMSTTGARSFCANAALFLEKKGEKVDWTKVRKSQSRLSQEWAARDISPRVF